MKKKIPFYNQQKDESDTVYIMRLYLMLCTMGLLCIPTAALIAWILKLIL